MAGKDLVEFVLARITEDEAVANDAIDRHPIGYDWAVRDPADADYVARWNPWRILNVCNIRRRIVATHMAVQTPTGEFECAACDFRSGQAGWPCDTISLLVLDWVEHPCFREEWLHRTSTCGPDVVARGTRGRDRPPGRLKSMTREEI